MTAREVMNELRWQALQADAEASVQGGAGSGPVPGGSEEAEPVVGSGVPGLASGATSRDPETRRQIEAARSDGYELKSGARHQQRAQTEQVAQDIEADREARVGRHMRLAHHPPAQAQAPQNLLGTLASQRKADVRSRRRVGGKRGAQTSKFEGALHPGLWRAQPIADAKAQVVRTAQRPRAPARRQAIAIT